MSYFSVAVIKKKNHPDKSNIRVKVFNLAHSSRGYSPSLWEDMAPGGEVMVTGSGRGWPHFIHTQEAEREQKIELGSRTSRPSLSDSHPLVRLYLQKVLEVSQMVPPTGDQAFKHISLCFSRRRTLTSRPQQSYAPLTVSRL